MEISVASIENYHQIQETKSQNRDDLTSFFLDTEFLYSFEGKGNPLPNSNKMYKKYLKYALLNVRKDIWDGNEKC